MSGSPHAVKTDDLAKRYRATTAVDGVDLRIPSRCVYGFLGPNGAGKTTTLRLLTGLVEPTSGSARVAGVDPADRARLVDRIGYLPETPPLYDELTGREQLRFAAAIRDRQWDDVADRALELCDALALSTDLDRRVDAYSTGMRRKLGFVQAAQHDPDVLFLDEPTSGLDPGVTRALRELIADAGSRGTVVLSTHVLSVVEAVADRVGVFDDGRLVAEGEPEAIADGRADGDVADGLERAFVELTEDERGRARREDGPAGRL
ncbi:ABC transporter ATP-binding protein [Halomicrobium salinisoli]|uniref:ABC transporter ATP-binding protein n=1 Tax=Halomicrobium salinisoli TaxID=2878391 RepID=UPI001CF0B5DD|nr:ABC transporter ATP-binding protein [Halomicrobium salinisoli]